MAISKAGESVSGVSVLCASPKADQPSDCDQSEPGDSEAGSLGLLGRSMLRHALQQH